MTTRKNKNGRLGPALEAARQLWRDDFNGLRLAGNTEALSAYAEIERTPLPRKVDVFFRRHFPLRSESVGFLAEMYRRFFRVAIAHPGETDPNTHQWAWEQLQPSVRVTVEWIRNWYALACDGENERLRHIGSAEFEPNQTVSIDVRLDVPSLPVARWCAPSWLFQVSWLFAGIQQMRSDHVPDTNTEKRLNRAQTRLLLTGARRAFLLQLRGAIERVRNEETIVAVAVPPERVSARTRVANKRKGWESRLKLKVTIQKILAKNPELEGMDFCAALDKHHAPHLFDWEKSNQWKKDFTWKVAWRDRVLRRKIRRVRHDAMKSR